jgi:hypothetical protein
MTADVQTSEMDAKLEPSTWNHTIVYGDRSSQDEQLNEPFLYRNKKNCELRGQLEVKIRITVNLMEITQSLHLQWLDKCSLVHWKIMDIQIYIANLLTEACEYCEDAEFWGYVATNTDPFVEICNAVQCHVLVNHLTLSVCPSVYSCLITF